MLLLATDAKVSALIPMYAIGVFTGFTMAGAGMLKHHLSHRDQHWKKGVAVSGVAAVICAVIVVVFAITEFAQGGWVIVIVMPLIVFGLVRTNREYRTEDAVLEEGAAMQACEAQILRRNVVVILVDRIDLATARAIQYARSLTPDDLRAVHFNIDHPRTERLIARWQRLGLSRLPLDIIDCPDRRLGRASLELAAELADGETEVSILLPRRTYGRAWRRILHDQTADRIVEVVSQLSHVNATIVPFVVAPGIEQEMALEVLLEQERRPRKERKEKREPSPPRRPPKPDLTELVSGTTPISELAYRTRTRIAGRVKTLRVQPWAQAQSLECVLVDGSGHAVTLVFLGRRSVSGIRSGSLLVAEGMVGKHRNKLAIINPSYELLSVTEASDVD